MICRVGSLEILLLITVITVYCICDLPCRQLRNIADGYKTGLRRDLPYRQFGKAGSAPARGLSGDLPYRQFRNQKNMPIIMDFR